MGQPAKPREPYGVAELFRQCLEHARIYKQRRRRTSKRLWVVLACLGLLFGVVFLVLLGFWLSA